MIISQTPLRISLVGGGTDIADYYRQYTGQVISSAIDKYVYVLIKERFDDLIVLHYTKNEVVSATDEIQHDLIREAMRLVGIHHGVEIITLADIPSTGSGLGSSSSVTVGLLNALHTFRGEQVAAEQLAREAVRIEVEILKKPIGKQDQYIAAFGGLRKFTFHPDERVETAPINLSASDRLTLGARLFLHFTNLTRNADHILSEQKTNITSTTDYWHGIAALVPRLEQTFATGAFDELGALLKENWALKERLASSISNKTIQAMVDCAMQGGATGCKIAGAGGGGFLLSYVPGDNQERFLRHMAAYRNLPFALDPFGTRIVVNLRRDTRFAI